MTKITAHWLEIALERIKAGDDEVHVMADYRYEPVSKNKALRNSISLIASKCHDLEGEEIEDKLNNLLSPNNPTDTGITKEMSENAKEFNDKFPDKEFSDWYDYKGEVDFKDGVCAEIEYMDLGTEEYEKFQHFDWSYVKRYRIKLDGVRVIEYMSIVAFIFNCKNGELIPDSDVIGHAPGNKIIVVRDKEKTNEEIN